MAGRSLGNAVQATADVTVEPGDTATFEYAVDVGEEQPVPTVDVLFCFDLTTSMEEEISTVKTRAKEISDALEAKNLEPAFGVSGFKDYQGTYDSYGYQATYASDTEYAWKVHRRITEDIGAFETALDAISPGNGPDDDGPENYTRALYEFEHGDIGWRDNALRLVVLFGDSIPHDDDFHEIADQWGSYPTNSTGGDPGRDGEMFTGDDLDFQRVVQDLSIPVIGVNSGDYTASWQYIAEQTGGAYFELVDASDIPETIVELVGSEAERVTLTLESGIGFDQWLTFEPERFQGVGAGETRTFTVSIRPPEHATLGHHVIPVFAVADGSVIDRRERIVNVYGSTLRPVAAAKVSGTGAAWQERKRVYEWFAQTLARGYWANKQTAALRRFSNGLNDSVEDVVSELPQAVLADLAGAGYYEDMLAFSKASITTVETVKLAQIADIMRRGVSRIPGSKHIDRQARIERIRALLEGGDRAKAVEEIGLTDIEYTGSGADRSITRCGPSSFPESVSLLEHLCHWRKAIAGLDNPFASGITWDFGPKETRTTIVIDANELEAGHSETVSLTAPPRTHAIDWMRYNYGGFATFLDLGDYEYTITLPKKPAFGPKSKTASSDGEYVSFKKHVWSDTGYTEQTVVSGGDQIEFTVEVVSEPVKSALPWVSFDDFDRVAVDVSLLHDYEWEQTDIGSDTARQGWEDSRQVALNQIDSAIKFFEAERDLLQRGDVTHVSVASPVDLHVEDDRGQLGAVYEDGDILGIETSLGTDFLYSGPVSEPEGLALLDADGDYSVTVRGRDRGTYDLTVQTALMRPGGYADASVVREVTKAPITEGEDQELSLTIEASEEGPEVAVDIDSLRAKRTPENAISRMLPLQTIPKWVPTLSIAVGLALILWAWIQHQSSASEERSDEDEA